jgi:hypothetical protein
MSRLPPVVIDNGTGYVHAASPLPYACVGAHLLTVRAPSRSYTKMGYAGNNEPQFIIPTVIGTKDERSSGTGTIKGKKGIEDLDFYIGDEAMANAVSGHTRRHTPTLAHAHGGCGAARRRDRTRTTCRTRSERARLRTGT